MIRAPWSRLEKSGVRSLVKRLAERFTARRCGRSPDRATARDRRSPVRRSRPRNLHFHLPAYVVAVEALEERILLYAMAVDDSYSVAHDHTIAPTAAAGVIANDFN